VRAARALLVVGALAAASALSGCVAAAIPVLAAGGVFQSQRHDGEPDRAQDGEPRVSVDVSPPAEAAGPQPGTLVRTTTLADGTRVDVMAGPLGAPAEAREESAEITPLSAAPVEASADDLPGKMPIGEGARDGLLPAALPPSNAAGANPGYDTLYDFAERQARLPVAGSERYSAILAQPLDLRPETKECSIHPVAVLVDLDPAGGTLDPAAATHADAQLAAKLAALRADDVAIGWISSNSADRAGDVRRALVSSGLDPDGRDELVLMRYPDERKQTRREDFASEFCLVAIAGDNRGDFDELFDYIKNPFLAAPLDALLGNGWFLIPQPLT
jgi:hypothetical protein